MKKLTALLVGAMLMMASNAMAIYLPAGSWGSVNSFLELPYFPGTEVSISSLDFTGAWKYTAIGAESGNYNIVEKPAANNPSAVFNPSLSGDVTFTTANTSNWGLWNTVNFNQTNLFFEDSNGPMNIKLDPFTATSTPGFKIFQLVENSNTLNYLSHQILLSKGTYIIGFNDNSLIDANDSDYDDILIAITPVPEPGTMVLLGFGMLGLAIYGKRRMNKEV